MQTDIPIDRLRCDFNGFQDTAFTSKITGYQFGDSLSVSLERKACAIEQSYIEVSNVSSEWVILNTQE